MSIGLWLFGMYFDNLFCAFMYAHMYVCMYGCPFVAFDIKAGFLLNFFFVIFVIFCYFYVSVYKCFVCFRLFSLTPSYSVIYNIRFC